MSQKEGEPQLDDSVIVENEIKEDIIDNDESILMFTYGTLRKGFHNHHYLEGAEYIGAATTAEQYSMYTNHADESRGSKGIPFVNPEEKKICIRGDVYCISEKMLKRIDGLEGHPNWYWREEIPVLMDGGEEKTAWIYFNRIKGNDAKGAQYIDSGDFQDA
eukprot:TRINITY_DN5002_c0_g2_i1.p1 TRINITY_DN5002_c0_g2~~TRINITY_DN5002_c0_g2_i1.p1  ORF type:complete len:161 (+),score=54.19 TRINITY_DN5002_c0_g2_i1:1-483(+)